MKVILPSILLIGSAIVLLSPSLNTMNGLVGVTQADTYVGISTSIATTTVTSSGHPSGNTSFYNGAYGGGASGSYAGAYAYGLRGYGDGALGLVYGYYGNGHYGNGYYGNGYYGNVSINEQSRMLYDKLFDKTGIKSKGPHTDQVKPSIFVHPE